MKILRQYLLNAIFPAVTVFIVGLIKMPANCAQCVGLTMVGSGAIFMFLLLLGLFYFLMFIKLDQSRSRFLVGIVATFSPTILLTIFLVKMYYHPERTHSTDFEIASPAIVTAFFISAWTFYLYMKAKPMAPMGTQGADS